MAKALASRRLLTGVSMISPDLKHRGVCELSMSLTPLRGLFNFAHRGATEFLWLICNAENLLLRPAKEVIDQIVAQFEIESACVLCPIQGVGVIGHDIRAAGFRIDVEVAAKAVLPSRVANKA
jgi:hypothetical protein